MTDSSAAAAPQTATAAPQTATAAPQTATAAPAKANPMEMRVETNAPVEQSKEQSASNAAETANDGPKRGRSKELATTEPKAAVEPVKDSLTAEQPVEIKPPQEQKDNELARERIRDRLRADELQRQLEASNSKDSAPEKEPNINDYKTLEEYQADYKKWAKEEGKREERAAQTQIAEQQRQEKIRIDVLAREQESRAKHADYDAVIGAIYRVLENSPLLKHFIASNPMGTEVMYELGKNPVILDQIMRSGNVWEAGERLLAIAARLKEPKVAPITNAPPPIKPVGSREALKPDMAQLAAKDMNGYHAMRQKQRLAEKGIRVN